MDGFIRFITDPQNLLSIGVGVLVFATVLTLLVLPTMYAAWFKVKRTS